MKGTDFNSYINYRCQADSTVITADERVLLANIVKEPLALWIISKEEDYFEIPATQDLVAGQREYPLPTDALPMIKILEAKLDGTNWKRVWEFDLSRYGGRVTQFNPLDLDFNQYDTFSRATTDETTIQATFSDAFPMYDIERRSIKLYTGSAIIDVTGGLKLTYYKYPADITTTTLSSSTDLSVDPSTTTFGIPKQYHQLWADIIIAFYKETNNLQLSVVDQQTIELYGTMKQLFNNMPRRNQDRTIIPLIPNKSW